MSAFLDGDNLLESRSYKFKQAPAVETTKAGERVVLYHTVNGMAVVLNPSGTLLWRFIDRERSPDELANHLEKCYDTASVDPIADVEEFLDRLSLHSMIDTSEA